jgi:hypothetical protein
MYQFEWPTKKMGLFHSRLVLLCYNLIKNYKGCVILLSISEREFLSSGLHLWKVILLKKELF